MGQRTQSLQFLDIRNIKCTDHSLTIAFGDALTHTCPGCHMEPIKIMAYAPNRSLCPVTAYRAYMKPLCKDHNNLFIIPVNPYSPAMRDTLSNWVKFGMRAAGIDPTLFTPHRIRSAATTTASAAKIPLAIVLKTAGWTKECTFYKSVLSIRNLM